MSRGTPERLAYMANQIAANLAREADPVAATADHIASFWTPAMYDRLIDAGVSNLDDTARAAMELLAGQRGRALRERPDEAGTREP